MAGNSATPGVSVSARLLAVLGAFDAEHPDLSLTELARRAEVPVTTTHRLVGELVEWGALAQTPSGSYVIGRRLWDVGLLAPVPSDLREVASPFLHDVYGATLATVHLAVRDGTGALYLERLAGHSSVPVISKVGARLPLHATGVGKVLLAHAPQEVTAAVLARLTRHTPYTVMQPGRMARQLGRIRQEGYAQTVDEMTVGACSVAVPVRGRDDEVVAALGVVVADLRRGRDRLVTALSVAARGIGRGLRVREHH
ncbi:MAG TPA: IclR family transcriptional regulator [Pseudonocardia sp.]